MLRPYQNEAIAAAVQYGRSGEKRALIVLPTGCHAKGQGILMYDGSIKAVEAIQVGDALMGPDSMPRTVLDLAHGEAPMWEVRPVKGKSWYVNLDHVLTLVRTRERNGERGGYPSTIGGQIVNVSVRTYWDEWSKYKKHTHKLFRMGVEFPEQDLEYRALPPYILGLVLGDGTLATEGKATLTSIDPEVIDEYKAFVQSLGLHVRTEGIMHHAVGVRKKLNPFIQALRWLHLSGIRGHERFVPFPYTVAYRDDRLELLAGLIDTDGHYRDGGFEFLSKSEHLSNDVVFLSRSLGLAAYISPKIVDGTYFYRVSISGDCSIVPTRIPRKQAPARKQIKDVLRTGFSVHPTGRIEKYYGFELDGDKRYLLSDFTVTHNTGKTVIFCAMAARASKKVLVLAHREELLKQTLEKIHETDYSLKATLEQASNRMEPNSKVVVASVQTLARTPQRLHALHSQDFSLVILDEAHHATARSYIDILSHFGLMPRFDTIGISESTTKREWQSHASDLMKEWEKPDHTAPFLCGFTATPHRSDGRGLEWVFDEIVYSKSMIEMMREGWLIPIRGIRIGTEEDISGVKKSRGDYAIGELSAVVNTEDRNQLAVDSYKRHANGRSTIVFAVDVEHAMEITKCFRDAGLRSEYVVGARGRMERNREDIIKEFRAGGLKILVNCMVLTEGFDAPECSCIIMARPTYSSLLYTQMIGRGTRIAEGKKDLLVIDLVDMGKRTGLATVNTLFGLPPNIAPGNLLTTMDAYEDMSDMTMTDDMLENATSLDDLKVRAKAFDPLLQVQLPVGMSSRFSWVRTGFGYALSIPGGPQLGIVENLLMQGELKIKRPGFTSERLGTYSSARAAMVIADEYAENNFEGKMNVVRVGARWRRNKPSQKQLAAAVRAHIKITDAMTSGDVSDLLGARYAGRR